jgi:hypothetical protein
VLEIEMMDAEAANQKGQEAGREFAVVLIEVFPLSNATFRTNFGFEMDLGAAISTELGGFVVHNSTSFLQFKFFSD